MSDALALFHPLAGAAGSLYSEAPDRRCGAFERAYGSALRRTGLDRSSAWRLRRFVVEVDRAAREFDSQDASGMRSAAAEIGRALRAGGLHDGPVARAFALVRTACSQSIGMRIETTELMAARAALLGRIAEIEPEPRRAVAAMVAGATAALAGLRVHMLAADGGVAARRFDETAAVYRALGLDVACVTGKEGLEVRRAAYRSAVVLVGARDLGFDYLRDRLVLHGRPGSLALEVEALAGGTRLKRLLLGGLHCAIVEEADRVLVDEAAAPLAILGPEYVPGLNRVCRQALETASTLDADADFTRASDRPGFALTDAGRSKLDAMAEKLGGAWRGVQRREALVCSALVALRSLERDRDYTVRDGRVMLGAHALTDDEFPEASHRMLEIKEGIDAGDNRRTLARLGPERFFRRYLLLGGFIGARPGVARPLVQGYGLHVARIDRNVPGVGTAGEVTIARDTEAKLQLVVERAHARASAGETVLVVTHEAGADAAIRAALDALGTLALSVGVAQDGALSPEALERARVIIAPASTLGVLPASVVPDHLISVDLLPTRWAQRRVLARAGARGSAETIASLADPIFTAFGDAAAARMAQRIDRTGEAAHGRRACRLAELVQQRAERETAHARADSRRVEDYLGDALAFSGRGI